MDGVDGSSVPVPERGGPSSPSSARSVLLGASAGRQGKDLEVCSVQSRSSMGRWSGGGPPECTGDPGRLPMGSGAVCGQRWGDGPVLVCPGPSPSLRNIRGRGDVQYPLLCQTWRRPPISPTLAQSVRGYKDVLLLLITIDCQLGPSFGALRLHLPYRGYLQATSFLRGPQVG